MSNPENSIKPSRLHRGIAVCCWLYLLIVLAAWVLLHFGDLWWPATLLMFSPRWLLATPSLPLAFAALLWRRRLLAVVLLALLLVLGPIMGFQVPWRAAVSAAPPGMRLRVMTWNMHGREPYGPILELLLAEADPDVVAVQEPLRGTLDYFVGEEWQVDWQNGHFLASRYPIRQAVSVSDNSMKAPGSIMRYELETSAGRVTLFSLHFATPRKGLTDTMQDLNRGFIELESNSALRWQQSEILARLVDEATSPVLVVGDFNTPPESAVFRRVWGRYTDAFSSSGWGWGYTYFTMRKIALRIDHILAGPEWSCQRCWVGPNVGSQHHPLLAELILSQLPE